MKHTDFTIVPIAAPVSDSFEQERREVFASVFEVLNRHSPDADEMAACQYLVRHLNREPDRKEFRN